MKEKLFALHNLSRDIYIIGALTELYELSHFYMYLEEHQVVSDRQYGFH